MVQAQSLFDERSDQMESIKKDIEEQNKKVDRAERVSKVIISQYLLSKDPYKPALALWSYIN